MQLLDGKATAKEIREEVKKEVGSLGKQPQLDVVLVGENQASQTYVRMKEKACEEVGIKSNLHKLPESTSQEELVALVKKLNNDSAVNGVLVQLPLPKHISEEIVIDTIAPEKDVDCFHPHNVGKLYQGQPVFKPCTPQGIIELLERHGIEIKGKNVVVIGRSNIVGKPVAALVLAKHGTVTTCHSRTKDLPNVAKQADILIVAIGKAKFVTPEFVKQGAIVIDVGMDRDENGKLCGDVNFEAVKDKCSWITPVPGGVGPMTVAMLMVNTLQAFKMQEGIK